MELSHLKDIAAKLNMNVHHNIGVEKLTKQIKERCEELGTTIEEVSLSVQKAQNDPESSETSVGTLEDTPEVIEENKDVESTPAYDPAYIEKLKHITFAAAEAQRITDEATTAVRIFLQDIDNLLTGLSIPHISGFGSVWRPSTITNLGIMQLSRVPMSQIRAELGV